MEFNEKLQELRKQKGLTQEELAQVLYVSRAAVSKWESAKGYPNIESLKALAKFFSVTIDELLSGEEVLDIAQKDSKEKEKNFCDLVFGLLDISVLMFCFLPVFGQRTEGIVNEVSLMGLNGINPFIKISYWGIVLAIVICGIATLAFQKYSFEVWEKYKIWISLILNGLGIVLFTISLQPYAAVFMLFFAVIKVIMLIKKS